MPERVISIPELSEQDIEECNKLTEPLKKPTVISKAAGGVAAVLGIAPLTAACNLQNPVELVRPAHVYECPELPVLCSRIDHRQDEKRPVIYWKQIPNARYNIYEREVLYKKRDPNTRRYDEVTGRRTIASGIPDRSISEVEIVNNPGVETRIYPYSIIGASERKVPWQIVLDYHTGHLISIEACVDSHCIQSEEMSIHWNPGNPILWTFSQSQK